MIPSVARQGELIPTQYRTGGSSPVGVGVAIRGAMTCQVGQASRPTRGVVSRSAIGEQPSAITA
jgi:hypothetical protein